MRTGAAAERKGQTVAHRGRRNADDALALALATGQTLRDAAQTAGIGERPASRRWADRARLATLLLGQQAEHPEGRGGPA